eukprot:7518677-Alexandrium_andersonii.AAC.1
MEEFDGWAVAQPLAVAGRVASRGPGSCPPRSVADGCFLGPPKLPDALSVVEGGIGGGRGSALR